jgi:hypothetical protein
MNTKKRSERSSESGQALIMLALFLLGLLGMLAIVLDGGNIYLMRRRMQNAADSGALAGARELALHHSQTEAIAKAQEYCVTLNGAEWCVVTFEDEGRIIHVVAHINTPMTFARVVDIRQVMVSASAKATFGGLKETRGILAPIALYEPEDQLWYLPCCEEGQDPEDPEDPCTEEPNGCGPFMIWDDTTEDSDDGPWDGEVSGDLRGWATPSCAGCDPSDPECDDPVPECGDAGSALLSEWMQNGFPGKAKTKSWMRGDNGVKTKPVAITHTRVGQILLIAIYDEIMDIYPGKGYYHIKRLVAFLVTDVISVGNPKGIEGYVVNHSFTGGMDPTIPGASTFRLIH